jgi:hypothetical protein
MLYQHQRNRVTSAHKAQNCTHWKYRSGVGDDDVQSLIDHWCLACRHRGLNIGIAPLILNIRTRWRWMVKVLLPGKCPDTHCTGGCLSAWMLRRENLLPPPEFELRNVRSVVSGVPTTLSQLQTVQTLFSVSFITEKIKMLLLFFGPTHKITLHNLSQMVQPILNAKRITKPHSTFVFIVHTATFIRSLPKIAELQFFTFYVRGLQHHLKDGFYFSIQYAVTLSGTSAAPTFSPHSCHVRNMRFKKSCSI